jgi:hypothetical protein
MGVKARLTTIFKLTLGTAPGRSELQPCRAASAIISIFAAVLFARLALAVELTEPAGAAHGYPGLYDINGKKLADSEFRQWVENNRLHVVITHKFSAGEVYEEQAQLRQQPELIQEKWSWKESKHGKSQA